MRDAIKTAGLALAALIGVGATTALADTTMYVGTDENTFNGVLPDQLAAVTVSGANLVSVTNYSTSFHLNGVVGGAGNAFLYTGDPFSNTINKVSLTGGLLGSTSVTGMATSCCNESMIFSGKNLYHAQYGNGIQTVDLTTGTILSTQFQPDVVGIAYVHGQIWITHWGAQQVGVWDPTTNAFTPMFNTPTAAGALAFDPTSQILWVGLGGGTVVPYTLGGVAINAGFQPFGPTGGGDTIDGMTILGDSVPEPATWAMMILGVAGLGVALRSRKRVVAAA